MQKDPQRGRNIKTCSEQLRSLLPYIACIACFAVSAHLGTCDEALADLGVPVWGAIFLLSLTAGFKFFNVRAFVFDGRGRLDKLDPGLRRVLLHWRKPFAKQTAVLVNVGGAIVPLLFSFYKVVEGDSPPLETWLVAVCVALVSQLLLLPVSINLGTWLYALMTPACAWAIAHAFGVQHQAVLGYVGGSVGILFGKDYAQVGDLVNIGRPVVWIGRDVSYDAIFLNELFSMVLH